MDAMKALPEHGTWRSFTAEELDRLDVGTEVLRSFMFDVLRRAWGQPDATFISAYRPEVPTYTPEGNE